MPSAHKQNNCAELCTTQKWNIFIDFVIFVLEFHSADTQFSRLNRKAFGVFRFKGQFQAKMIQTSNMLPTGAIQLEVAVQHKLCFILLYESIKGKINKPPNSYRHDPK